jgi:hypothetical protein
MDYCKTLECMKLQNGLTATSNDMSAAEVLWIGRLAAFLSFIHWSQSLQIYKIEVAVDQSPNLQGLNLVAEMRQEMRAQFANNRIILSNSRIGGTGRVQLPLKAVVGHPAAHPADPALAAAGPIAVGTALPAAAFPAIQEWTRAAVMNLSGPQLNDLQWFYNEAFGGANIGERRNSFALFLGL